MEFGGQKRSRGMISCCATTWQNLPPHVSLRMARDKASFPSNGLPNVMQRREAGDDGRELELNEQRKYKAAREASDPPMEWPVSTTALFLVSDISI